MLGKRSQEKLGEEGEHALHSEKFFVSANEW